MTQDNSFLRLGKQMTKRQVLAILSRAIKLYNNKTGWCKNDMMRKTTGEGWVTVEDLAKFKDNGQFALCLTGCISVAAKRFFRGKNDEDLFLKREFLLDAIDEYINDDYENFVVETQGYRGYHAGYRELAILNDSTRHENFSIDGKNRAIDFLTRFYTHVKESKPWPK